MGIHGDNLSFRIYSKEETHALLHIANVLKPFPLHAWVFFLGFESTQLARQLHQERTQMEV